jgi:transcriptional regulator with XRE-family HTH domain
MRNIGHTLASIRQRCGLSQKDLARTIGVSDQMISSIEAGRRLPSAPTMEKIEKFFGIPAGIVNFLSADLDAVKRANAKLAPLIDSTAEAMWAAIDAKLASKTGRGKSSRFTETGK